MEKKQIWLVKHKNFIAYSKMTDPLKASSKD